MFFLIYNFHHLNNCFTEERVLQYPYNSMLEVSICCLFYKQFYWDTHILFTYLLSEPPFLLPWQSWAAATEVMWPAEF